MRSLLLTTGLVAVLFVAAPESVEASGYDHGYHGKHHHHKHRKYYRHGYRYRPYYWDYHYPHRAYHHRRYRDWPFRVFLDLDYHHRDRDEVIVVESGEGTYEETASASSQIFIYPREGQSAEQRDQDRYQCHLWSRDQTGFDPSRPGSNYDMASDYNRAMAACLEGRGYTVK